MMNKMKWAEDLRSRKEPTVPSTIGEENKINPFMRVGHPDVQKHAKKEGDEIGTMAALRKEKDSF